MSSAATQPATTAAARKSNTAHPAQLSPTRHSHARHAIAAAHGSAPTAKAGGVLALGATDITGNKELPKVMVIVPWKGSTGADGVMKPDDSLLDEVLEPVDRGEFQRQIHYYGQLNSGRPPSAAGQRHGGSGKVAPVGDSH
jgi:hypothetical protein